MPGTALCLLKLFLFRFFTISQFKRSAMPNGPKISSGGALSPRGNGVRHRIHRPGFGSTSWSAMFQTRFSIACFVLPLKLRHTPGIGEGRRGVREIQTLDIPARHDCPPAQGRGFRPEQVTTSPLFW